MVTSEPIAREHPAAVLAAEIRRVRESHGGLVLVTGEAGIGKSTLVAHAVQGASAPETLLLDSACWGEEGAPDYWPWIQLIRRYRRARPREWADTEAAVLKPLSALLGENPSPSAGDRGFRLHDAVTTLLTAASRHRPVVVVMEDLHWADRASVKLLQFVTQHIGLYRVLVIGTYRDAEIEPPGHRLGALLSELVARATVLPLAGLDQSGVSELVARTTGRAPDAATVSEIHLRTGGNPFFIEQVAHLWHSNGFLTGVTPGIRAALDRRLASLPPEVTVTLTRAAVLGREFSRKLLKAVKAEPRLDALLDQAVSARLIVHAGEGRHAFAHDLVRELLYDSLDEKSRRELHAAVVRGLRKRPSLAREVMPADLAKHATRAASLLTAAEVVGILLDAAEDASRRLAWEEAARHYQRALDTLPEGHPRQWMRIALDLGTAQYLSAELEGGRRTFESVIRRAGELDEHELLADAALTLLGLSHPTRKDKIEVDLVTMAYLKLVGDAGEPGGLDRAARELSAHATSAARAGHDDQALAKCLIARHDAILGPGTATERLAITEEVTVLARRTGDLALELQASQLRVGALLERGDPRCREEHRGFVAMAERSGLAWFRFEAGWSQATFATLAGRFDDARAAIDAAMASSDQPYVNSIRVSRHLRWALELAQGRFDEAERLLADMGDDTHPYPRLIKATTAIQKGELDHALRYLEEFAAEGAQDHHHGWFAPLWIRFQAQTAAASGDAALCAAARDTLRPLLGQWAVTAGATVDGPFSLWMAKLDASEHRWDDAVRGFTQARVAADRLHARPWSLEARLSLAGALRGRAGPGDEATAAELVATATAEAAELGMTGFAERIKAPAPTGGANVFRFDGDVWTIGFDGRSVTLPDAKGLRDLHYLLRHPGSDVPAVRLLNPAGGELVTAARGLGGDPVLDEQSKTRFRERLRLLDDELERATELENDVLAASLDREREALLDQLRRATGLHGRTRRLGDEAERARKAVTGRIRDSLRRLGERHPAAAEFLRASVHTGANCGYRPGREIAWKL
ncbi:AAA family ATPase [Amycolatopsis sp. TNS106]|uniref:ATP-binding protein n=1 Tax=Amycolatopsis sp. TNS106 TaxID=2861750 RepID=UPI0021028980|nr:AAA family ATPase [Amycolatopsis sp. TNS106]